MPNLTPDELAKKLPPRMAELHQLVGTASMVSLVEHYGGTRLQVPGRFHPGSELAQVLKAHPAKRLVKEYGGTVLEVGLCKEWRVHLLRSQGHTYAQIARRVGMTEFSVFRMINRRGAEGQPRPLKARRDAAERQLTLLID